MQRPGSRTYLSRLLVCGSFRAASCADGNVACDNAGAAEEASVYLHRSCARRGASGIRDQEAATADYCALGVGIRATECLSAGADLGHSAEKETSDITEKP